MAATADSPVIKRQKRPFSSTEKTMIYNMYNSFLEATPNTSINDILKTVASSMGVHWVSVYKIVKEKNSSGLLRSPRKEKPRLKVIDKTDNFTKDDLRHIVHQFFKRNEIPTLNKILETVNNDGTLGNFKRTSLHMLLRNIGFKFSKRSRNSMLTDRDDIFFWRRNYLRAIRDARQSEKMIFYLDETWVNEGHTTNKAWTDTTVQNAKYAFLNGLSTGLKNPSGKGKRLIITHIGSENGFVEGGLLVFESKKDGDYHKDMNAEVFEEWFTNILDKVPENSIIVLDNAPYHSRKIERVPTANSRKDDIIQWLGAKNITFHDDMLKRELMKIVKDNKHRYEAYVVDEMAKKKNIKVLRLPPYHCELNPIELIWAQVKGYVADNNKTFKLNEIKTLLNEAISKINSDKWQKYIKHVVDVVEPGMDVMDRNVENMTERFNINLASDSDSSEPESE